MPDWYQRVIVDPGKQPFFLMLVAFLVTFILVRILVRAIRQGRGPGRDISVGGVHVHHAVIGTVLMVAAGAGGFSVIGEDAPWAEIFAAFFGAGAALVLDEFALILRLDDVYWQREGRISVDAVFIGATLCGLLLTGVNPLGVEELPRDDALVEPTWEIFVGAVIHSGFVLVCLVKGKVTMGLLGLVVPFMAMIGAIRLARPRSPWARWRYAPGSRKALKARERELRRRRSSTTRARDRVYDAIAGKPNVPAAPTESAESTPEQQPLH